MAFLKRLFGLEDDRERFQREVIEQVAAMPLQRWQLIVDSSGWVSDVPNFTATTSKGAVVELHHDDGGYGNNARSLVALRVDGESLACEYEIPSGKPLCRLYYRVQRHLMPEIRRLRKDHQTRKRAEESAGRRKIMDKL